MKPAIVLLLKHRAAVDLERNSHWSLVTCHWTFVITSYSIHYTKLYDEQNDLTLKAAGLPDYAIQQNKLVQKAIFDILKNEPDSAKAVDELRIKLSQGMYNGMNDEMKKAVDDKIKGVNSPWFRFV